MIQKILKIIQSLSKTERQLLIGAGLIFIASSLAWGIIFFYQNTELMPAEGGNYNEGVTDQPITVNPIIAASETDRDIIELVFADLLDLTEQYRTSDDQKIWTFDLKPDLKWSDGEPLTANDVIFTLEAIQDSETRSPLYQTWQGVIGERISERQLRFILKTPYAFFLDNLRTFKIIPQHIFENIPTANIRLSAYNLEPVGSGPYMFGGYEKRKDGFITVYRLIANPHYSAQPPFIKKFSLVFFSNKEDLLAAFNQRKIDGAGGLGYNDLKEIKIGHQVFKINTAGYYSIFFNPALNAALKEKEVRQALNLSTDRQKIIKEVFADQATAVYGPILPSIPGYDPSLYQNEEFSVEKASVLLDEKGWKLNEENIRYKTAGGKKINLEFDVVIPQVEFLVKTMDIIKEDWQKIGVKINPIAVRPADVTGDFIKTRNYQMIIFGTILKKNPDLFSFWHSSERFYPGGNLAIFTNKNADGLLEAVKTAFDETERQSLLSKFQRIVREEQPAIFLFSAPYFYAASARLGGFESKLISGRSERFSNINQWYLETKRSFK